MISINSRTKSPAFRESDNITNIPTNPYVIMHITVAAKSIDVVLVITCRPRLWANPGIGGHSRKLKIKDFFKIMIIPIAYLVSNSRAYHCLSFEGSCSEITMC